jgi:hypothetical protein
MALFVLQNGKSFEINPTDSTVSLHGNMRRRIDQESHDIPYTKKLDPHVDRKRSLELQALINGLSVILRIQGTCEWQLFDVRLREKPDFLHHPGESTSCVSTAGKPKDTDLISDMIYLAAVSLRERSWRTLDSHLSIRNWYPSGISISHGKTAGREGGMKDL